MLSRCSQPTVKPVSCYNCFKHPDQRSSITQQYSELQEDFNWTDTCDNYDHLTRPNQANFPRPVSFDPTYSRTRDITSEYMYSSTLPSKPTIDEGEYSHVKGRTGGSDENGVYDRLQSIRMNYPDKEHRVQQIHSDSLTWRRGFFSAVNFIQQPSGSTDPQHFSFRIVWLFLF